MTFAIDFAWRRRVATECSTYRLHVEDFIYLLRTPFYKLFSRKFRSRRMGPLNWGHLHASWICCLLHTTGLWLFLWLFQIIRLANKVNCILKTLIFAISELPRCCFCTWIWWRRTFGDLHVLKESCHHLGSKHSTVGYFCSFFCFVVVFYFYWIYTFYWGSEVEISGSWTICIAIHFFYT